MPAPASCAAPVISDCNVFEVDEKFLGPAALAKAQRFVSDTRDENTLERVKNLSEYGGIWDCTHRTGMAQAVVCPWPQRKMKLL